MPFYYLCRPLRYYVCRESGSTVACRLSGCFISHTVPAAAAATVQWQQQQQQQVESGKNFVSVLWRLELFATCFPALPLPLMLFLLLLPQGLPCLSVCVCVHVCTALAVAYFKLLLPSRSNVYNIVQMHFHLDPN